MATAAAREERVAREARAAVREARAAVREARVMKRARRMIRTCAARSMSPSLLKFEPRSVGTSGDAVFLSVNGLVREARVMEATPILHR